MINLLNLVSKLVKLRGGSTELHNVVRFSYIYYFSTITNHYYNNYY